MGRVAIDQAMEHIHRHAEHARPHMKEPRGLIGKALLIGLERHPGRVWRTADASAEAQTIVLHARLTHHVGQPQVALHRFGQRCQVGVANDWRGRPSRQPSGGIPLVLRLETARSFGKPVVKSDESQREKSYADQPSHAP